MEDNKVLTSIIKNVKRDGLPATFRLCRDDRKYGDVLFSSVTNLKAMVRGGLGAQAVTVRKDLQTTSDWIDFCQAVSNGFSYVYAVDPSLEEPLQVRTAFDFPPEAQRIRFDILGLMPKVETQGWIFTATSIRQEKSTPDISTSNQITPLVSYKDDFILSWCVDFILTSTSERSVVKFVTITDSTISINENRPYDGKSDDDLKQLLIEMVTKVGVEALNNCTIHLITTGNDVWACLLKNVKIEF